MANTRGSRSAVVLLGNVTAFEGAAAVESKGRVSALVVVVASFVVRRCWPGGRGTA